MSFKDKLWSVSVVVRYIATLALVWLVYTETGKWTAISLMLLFIAVEALTLVLGQVIKADGQAQMVQAIDDMRKILEKPKSYKNN